MFNFFKRNKAKKIENYSSLGVDMHSHLLPGLDDGSPNMKTSLELIRALYKLGYRKLITTPHVMSDLYPNNKGLIRHRLGHLRGAIKKAKIKIEIEAGAEYLMDENFGALVDNDEIQSFGNNYVLVEMSFISEPPELHNHLFKLQTKGYRPILAHPERYLYMKSNFEKYEQIKNTGCLLQLNLLSLIGHYGKPTREVAIKLLKKGMIDFLGTDLHHERHAALLEKALDDKNVQKALSEHQFMNDTLF